MAVPAFGKSVLKARSLIESNRAEFRTDQSVGVATQDQMVSIAARMHFLIDRSCGVHRIAWELLRFDVAIVLRNLPRSGLIVVDS